jgi:NAD(P)-dependent dehydrogenase (short-subunit alcohol dehydrogenase family)
MSDVCVVIGVGPGNGEALVRRFSQEGYRVAMLARSQDYLEYLAKDIPDTHVFQYDATVSSRTWKRPASRISKPTGPVNGTPAWAEAVWNLCQQDPSAWTFELDVRPFGETW